MSDYPEHDKQAEVIEQTQAIGEFIEWLESQGVQLMKWREDLTDIRTPEMDNCKSWRVEHCRHFADDLKHDCCHCGRNHEDRVITGIKSFVHESRGIMQLLADWAGIDLNKIEAEKRQMLNALRKANEKGAVQAGEDQR